MNVDTGISYKAISVRPTLNSCFTSKINILVDNYAIKRTYKVHCIVYIIVV